MDLMPKVFRTEGDMVEFDPSRIMDSLIKETGLSEEKAKEITELAVRRIISSGIKFLSGPHIREIVCSILSEQHYEQERKLYTRIGMPLMDYEDILEKGPKLKSEDVFNPEKIHHWAANQIAKEYTLLRVLSDEESQAHLYGDIHIHELNYFDLRPLSQIWDPRIILKNGLPPGNGGSYCCKSAPADNLLRAVKQLATWLGMTQGEFSGNQGYSFITTFLAPYAKNLSDNEIKMGMNNLVYEINQVSALLGRDIPITSLFCSPSILDLFSDLPAIGNEGKVVGKYSDYNSECLKLFNSLTEVFKYGDYNGKAFSSPKHLIYFKEKWLKDYEHAYLNVWEEIVEMKTPYLVNLCPEWVNSKIKSEYITKDFVNAGILQNVCLNLPRCAYSSKNESDFIELIEDSINLCFGILNKKYNIIQKRLTSKHLPLCSSTIEGKPLFNLKNQKLTISFIGLNEAVKYLTNYELHEDPKSFDFGKKIIIKMNNLCSDKSLQDNKNYCLVENPSENAKYRFAKLDLIHFTDKAKLILETEKSFYTNSNHFNSEVKLDFFEQINKQGEFHEIVQNKVIEHISLLALNGNYNDFREILSKISNNTNIGCLKFIS